MDRIDDESLWFYCPSFADEFVGREPLERLEAAAEVICGNEALEMGSELIVVDERGLPVRPALTQGQASNKAAAPGLLERLPSASVVIADRGYDWQHLVDLVRQRGGEAHIPTQRDRRVQRSVDPSLYRQRNLVERFFCKLKHFRRVATRYDKLATNFLAAVALASARLWMRIYESTT
jgi:transposase